MAPQLLHIFSGLSVCLSVKILREYHYVNSTKTWAEAQEYCRSTFNDLATVENQVESDELRSVVPDGQQHAWIGLYDDGTKWKWSKGNKDFNYSVDYNNWRNTEPDNKGSLEGCTMMVSNGQWHDRNCKRKKSAVCLNEQGGSRFVSVETKMSWEEAKNYCRSNYTDLAVVQNETENKEIAKLIRIRHWIGLHRELWSSWSDQTLTSFTNWEKTQPDNNDSKRTSCATVDTATGAWWDFDCRKRRHFICQSVSFPPVRKQTTFRLKFKSEANITQHALKEQILMQEKLEMNEASNFTLHWKVFQRQKKKKGWGC